MSSRNLQFLTAAAAALLLLSAPLAAQNEIPELTYKWSQPPDLDNGWGVASFVFPYGDNDAVSIPAADDWKCADGQHVRTVHWWASIPPLLKEQGVTLQNMPGPPLFAFAIHADIPAAGGIPSHPGERLWAGAGYWADDGDFDDNDVPFPVGPVFYDPEPFGPDNGIVGLYYVLPEPFAQIENDTYWLSIASVMFPDEEEEEDMGSPLGWHTALRPGADNGLDVTVRMTDYDIMTGGYAHWDVMYDEQGGVQLAFELSTEIPEPTSLALVGTVTLTLIGLRRRRRLH